eukprot:RCo038978
MSALQALLANYDDGPSDGEEPSDEAGLPPALGASSSSSSSSSANGPGEAKFSSPKSILGRPTASSSGGDLAMDTPRSTTTAEPAADPADKELLFEEFLQAPVYGSEDLELSVRVRELRGKQQQSGISLVQSIQQVAPFRNPELLRVVRAHLSVADFGTNLPREIWNPMGEPVLSGLELMQEQDRARKERLSKRTEIQFTPSADDASHESHFDPSSPAQPPHKKPFVAPKPSPLAAPRPSPATGVNPSPGPSSTKERQEPLSPFSGKQPTAPLVSGFDSPASSHSESPKPEQSTDKEDDVEKQNETEKPFSPTTQADPVVLHEASPQVIASGTPDASSPSSASDMITPPSSPSSLGSTPPEGCDPSPMEVDGADNVASPPPALPAGKHSDRGPEAASSSASMVACRSASAVVAVRSELQLSTGSAEPLRSRDMSPVEPSQAPSPHLPAQPPLVSSSSVGDTLNDRQRAALQNGAALVSLSPEERAGVMRFITSTKLPAVTTSPRSGGGWS